MPKNVGAAHLERWCTVCCPGRPGQPGQTLECLPSCEQAKVGRYPCNRHDIDLENTAMHVRGGLPFHALKRLGSRQARQPARCPCAQCYLSATLQTSLCRLSATLLERMKART